MIHPNIQMLEIVAQGLSDLRKEVVFVGGATTGLYIKDPGAPEIRPTDDVDCIVEISTHGDFYKFEKKLRMCGFKNRPPEQGRGIIARWEFSGITVDVMPTEEKILGFSNRWYRGGIKHREKATLPSGLDIFILSLPYFLATKIEAFHGRGKKDFRLSSDMEDIVAVIDGSENVLPVINAASADLRNQLVTEFKIFFADRGFTDGVYAHLPGDIEGGKRAKRVIQSVQSISELETK